MNWIFWLCLAILLAVVEALTINMVSAWFATGAVVAMILDLYNYSLEIQIVIFLIVSIILFVCFVSLVKPRLNMQKNNSEPTNADRLIGCRGVVSSEIDNLNNCGRVKVRGQDWSAYSQNNVRLAVGTEVEVKAIKGVKLIVADIE